MAKKTSEEITNNEEMKNEAAEQVVNAGTKQQSEKAMSDEPNAQPEKNEITIKTAKGLVGEPFKAKDGKEYCEVKIPNRDENDKSPWKSFVVRAANIHDDKFGKGKWFKLPAEGTTTVSQSVVTGQDENGKNVYENKKERVTNTELKGMVEFYKDRDRSQEQDKGKEPLVNENGMVNPNHPDFAGFVADAPAGRMSFKDQMKEAKAEAEKENTKKPELPKAKSKTKGQEI